MNFTINSKLFQRKVVRVQRERKNCTKSILKITDCEKRSPDGPHRVTVLTTVVMVVIMIIMMTVRMASQ